MRPNFQTHCIRLLVLGSALLSLSTLPAVAQANGAQDRLWDSAMQGDTAAVAAALQLGASIDALDTRRNPNGRRALNWAAWYDRPEAIRQLVARGAHINLANLTGFTPLHHAAENGSLDAARALVALDADWLLLNENGERPVDVARRRGHLNVVALLDPLPEK